MHEIQKIVVDAKTMSILHTSIVSMKEHVRWKFDNVKGKAIYHTAQEK